MIITEELGCTLKNKVFKGTWRETDVVVKYALGESREIARKRSKGSSLEGNADVPQSVKEQYEELLHEISILQSIRHPDLVMFLGACLQDEPLMFLTEYMPGGDLERYYQAKRVARQGIYRPPKQQLLAWSRALCRALSFLHGCSPRIIHRDLKPLNLLLTHTLELKITDFGISKLTSMSVCCDPTKMTGGVGSLRYMAPEVVRHEQYNEKADIYSTGLILYFMSSGRDPFYEHGINPEVVLEKFIAGEEPRPLISDCHQFLKHIMEQAWHPKAARRPRAADLCHMLSEIRSGSVLCTIS